MKKLQSPRFRKTFARAGGGFKGHTLRVLRDFFKKLRFSFFSIIFMSKYLVYTLFEYPLKMLKFAF